MENVSLSPQGIAENRRISIRKLELSHIPRSIYNEITVEYQVQIPQEKYIGKSPDGAKHLFKKVVGVEFEGSITMPIDPDTEYGIAITNALNMLKIECERKLSEILNVPLDISHPDNQKDKNEPLS